MATVLTTRETAGAGATVKNAPLTNEEVDLNFISITTNKLEASNNLSDLTDVTVARSNLGVSPDDNVEITGGSITGIADLDIADGGTGASTASDARVNLGLEVGVDVQAFDVNTAKYDDATANFTGDLQSNGSSVVTDSDIGSTVQAYDPNILVSGDIGSTVQPYDVDTAKYDDAIANFTGDLQVSGSSVVTETDISFAARYNDAIANFTGDLQVSGSSVVTDSDIGSTVQAYDVNTAKYDDATANFVGDLQVSGSSVVTDSDIGINVQAYDPNILVSGDIGSTVQAYDPNILVSGDIGSTVQSYDVNTAKYDDATANFVGDLQSNGSSVITESDIGSTVQSQIQIDNETQSSSNFYPTLSSNTSGNLSDTLNVSDSKLYYQPSTGTLNATVFNSLSDISVKTNVNEIDSGLDVINAISGVEFDWKDSGNHSAGVIAQELEKVLPHLVSTSDKGMKSVNYAGLTAYLLSAVKELSNRIK